MAKHSINSSQDEHVKRTYSQDSFQYQHIGDESEVLLPKDNKTYGEVGRMDLLSQKYESLDYDIIENSLYKERENELHKKVVIAGRVIYNLSYDKQVNLSRWFLVLIIGVLTAATGALITIAIVSFSKLKFSLLKPIFSNYIPKGSLALPLLMWMAPSIIAALGSILVTYFAPVAAGSGIPVIKCYLNGIKVPEVVRFKTFVSKALGVILSVVGGLAVGKEGPMIHCGAIIAAGVSQGKSTTFRRDFGCFKEFREDHEKRDFVSAGAAAGVAAAFGSPIGGVLFSLEEGASFWNQMLTWRIFFCSMVSSFFLYFALSIFTGVPGELNYFGLFNFGKFQDISYNYFELPLYICMGAFGGLMGAFFNFLNHKIMLHRVRNLKRKWAQVIEAFQVALVTAICGYTMMIHINDCRPLTDDHKKLFQLQLNCPDRHYNSFATLWFQTPEENVKDMFHGNKDMWSAGSLLLYCLAYQLLTCWTYGLSISSGVFIPSLLVGACWGRLVAYGLSEIWPEADWVHASKFSLLGAAANLGGVVRMTISLTVILLEATGNISLGLPVMLTLLVAKWVGDRFNEGLYDIHIRLNQVPILHWEPPPKSHNIYASEVMSTPAICFRTMQNVREIVNVLQTTPHNGFPVIDPQEDEMEQSSTGRFRGLILRWQLIVLLHQKLFIETSDRWCNRKLTLNDFTNYYPRYHSISNVHLTEIEKNYTLDLRPFMNPSPYSVSHATSLSRMFKLFRGLGLRHLVVVNDRNRVVGMVTRKDLARFCTNGESIQEMFICE